MRITDEPYKTRPIRFLGLWRFGNWRMKAYGIAYDSQAPSDELIHAARSCVEKRIYESAANTDHYEVGFIGIHQGKTGNFVFVDWWANENELYHHVYISTGEQPQALQYVTPSGLTACTWDLKLIGFERDAWVKTILMRHPTPDLEAYIAQTLDTDV